jgi:hypothetical protein
MTEGTSSSGPYRDTRARAPTASSRRRAGLRPSQQPDPRTSLPKSMQGSWRVFSVGSHRERRHGRGSRRHGAVLPWDVSSDELSVSLLRRSSHTTPPVMIDIHGEASTPLGDAAAAVHRRRPSLSPRSLSSAQVLMLGHRQPTTALSHASRGMHIYTGNGAQAEFSRFCWLGIKIPTTYVESGMKTVFQLVQLISLPAVYGEEADMEVPCCSDTAKETSDVSADRIVTHRCIDSGKGVKEIKKMHMLALASG